MKKFRKTNEISIKCILFALYCTLSLSFTAQAQERSHALEINKKMGRGINYGNMYEAPTIGGWGVYWDAGYAQQIADLGFNHVRIPIRWEPSDRSDATAPYTLSSDFLNTIKEVVDSVLNTGMLAIINLHHHEDLYEDPTGNKERFLSHWTQISEYFKDYNDHLIFEILNEPHGNLSAELWNEFYKDALDVIRIENPDRVALLGVAEYGGLAGLSKLDIVDDPNLILTVHYYNPFKFTHQGASWSGEESKEWLGTKWNDTELERQTVRDEFAQVIQLSKEKNIPIHVGEFGAYSTADIDSRARWTTFLARYFEEIGFSWAYWEFCAGFGIYNPTNKQYETKLVDALLYNEMPEARTYNSKTIYQPNLKETFNDWYLNLYSQSTASATKQLVGESIEVEIDALGSDNWHIQLLKAGITLEADKQYRLSVDVSASSERILTVQMGLSHDPWTVFASTSAQVSTDTSSIAVVVEPLTDTDNARINFELGADLASVQIHAVHLEEIWLDDITDAPVQKTNNYNMYPNPCKTELTITQQGDYQTFSLYTLTGKMVKQEKINTANTILDLREVNPGIYPVVLEGNGVRTYTKLLIE